MLQGALSASLLQVGTKTERRCANRRNGWIAIIPALRPTSAKVRSPKSSVAMARRGGAAVDFTVHMLRRLRPGTEPGKLGRQGSAAAPGLEAILGQRGLGRSEALIQQGVPSCRAGKGPVHVSPLVAPTRVYPCASCSTSPTSSSAST